MREWLRERLLLLSILVGVLSGLAGALFVLTLDFATQMVQGDLLQVSNQVTDAIHLGHSGLGTPWVWFLPLVPALGGLACGLLIWRWAPEAAGAGLDPVIGAFHKQRGRIRWRVPLAKAAATLLTLVSGGSGGTQGPIGQIGAGLGAMIGEVVHVSAAHRRALMLAGVAAAIGGVFHAPVGGALLAIGLLYREDLETGLLVPCVISGVTGFAMFSLFAELSTLSATAVFNFPPMRLHLPGDFAFYLLLGVVTVLVAKVYVRLMKAVRGPVMRRLPLPKWLRPAAGGLGVGLLALISIKVLGRGDGFLQQVIDLQLDSIDPRTYWHLAGAFTLLLGLKILATVMTIASGGSAGVFGPSLVIGGWLGAAVGLACHALVPGLDPPPLAGFIMIGMAGLFAAVVQAPVGTVIMICEMTESYALLAPLLLVCLLNGILTRRESLYVNQVTDRFHSPVHRQAIDEEVLGDVTVAEWLRPEPLPTVRRQQPVGELRDLLQDAETDWPLLVVDGEQAVGLLRADQLPVVLLPANSQRPIGELAATLVALEREDTLLDALRCFDDSACLRLPVLTDGRMVGSLRYRDLLVACGYLLTSGRTI